MPCGACGVSRLGSTMWDLEPPSHSSHSTATQRVPGSTATPCSLASLTRGPHSFLHLLHCFYTSGFFAKVLSIPAELCLTWALYMKLVMLAWAFIS